MSPLAKPIVAGGSKHLFVSPFGDVYLGPLRSQQSQERSLVELLLPLVRRELRVTESSGVAAHCLLDANSSASQPASAFIPSFM